MNSGRQHRADPIGHAASKNCWPCRRPNVPWPTCSTFSLARIVHPCPPPGSAGKRPRPAATPSTPNGRPAGWPSTIAKCDGPAAGRRGRGPRAGRADFPVRRRRPTRRRSRPPGPPRARPYLRRASSRRGCGPSRRQRTRSSTASSHFVSGQDAPGSAWLRPRRTSRRHRGTGSRRTSPRPGRPHSRSRWSERVPRWHARLLAETFLPGEPFGAFDGLPLEQIRGGGTQQGSDDGDQTGNQYLHRDSSVRHRGTGYPPRMGEVLKSTGAKGMGALACAGES
jgi:hypothetical protein